MITVKHSRHSLIIPTTKHGGCFIGMTEHGGCCYEYTIYLRTEHGGCYEYHEVICYYPIVTPTLHTISMAYMCVLGMLKSIFGEASSSILGLGIALSAAWLIGHMCSWFPHTRLGLQQDNIIHTSQAPQMLWCSLKASQPYCFRILWYRQFIQLRSAETLTLRVLSRKAGADSPSVVFLHTRCVTSHYQF